MEKNTMPRCAAFFDLDGTLIDVNSALLWARYEQRMGNVSRLQTARVTWMLLLYKLAIVDVERLYAEAVRRYEGVERADLDRRTRDWFIDEVAGRIRPGAVTALEEHRRRGHPLVLLTSVSGYEAAIAMETWNMDGWLANEFPFDTAGRLTGDVPSPLCYGAGKVDYAEAYAKKHDIDLDNSWFYTDSYTDLPMLERVANPRIVGPDPRLKLAARRRGWPILPW
ncbi:MAG: HAD superfamily hydrolase (TIGR01490 family) [Myxococcota bacterium]